MVERQRQRLEWQNHATCPAASGALRALQARARRPLLLQALPTIFSRNARRCCGPAVCAVAGGLTGGQLRSARLAACISCTASVHDLSLALQHCDLFLSIDGAAARFPMQQQGLTYAMLRLKRCAVSCSMKMVSAATEAPPLACEATLSCIEACSSAGLNASSGIARCPWPRAVVTERSVSSLSFLGLQSSNANKTRNYACINW